MIIEPGRLDRLIEILKSLSEPKLHWVEKVTSMLQCSQKFTLKDEELMNEDWFFAFGDALMIHHAFSNEPFTKDKFEHALVNTAKLVDINADFAPRGNRGHDILIDNVKYSLKTQADRDIKSEIIWISKYMELGKGEWSDQPEQLKHLVDIFLNHLQSSDRILILRCLKKAPIWKYELVEIPKYVLERSASGKLQMMSNSKQMPKPGYCIVKSETDLKIDFKLYFDGGAERKLQVKDLRKSICKVIGEWIFEPNI